MSCKGNKLKSRFMHIISMFNLSPAENSVFTGRSGFLQKHIPDLFRRTDFYFCRLWFNFVLY